jgi:hypothetical protein
MKLRSKKEIARIYPTDRTDWAIVTLRKEGDGLDDKEQEEIDISVEEEEEGE